MIPRRKTYILNSEFSALIRALLKRNAYRSPYVAEWEEVFARYIGVRYAVAVSSGRHGMELIFKALSLNAGDEVIIPAYTLKDLIGIIQSLGLTVNAVDINPKTFNIDPDSIIRKITPRTRVILATHLFGMPCQIERILNIAKPKSIFVIEDCAHSVGAEFKGRKTGSFGDAAFFSFETIKPVNTYGGGMVVTNDTALAGRVRKATSPCQSQRPIPIKKIMSAFLENIFLPTPLSLPFLYLLASRSWNRKIYRFYRAIQKPVGSNQVFTDFQAFIGLEKLKTLTESIRCKQAKAILFKSLLNDKIQPQQVEDGVYPNYYFFVALLPSSAQEVRMFLLWHGIDAGIGAEIADDCGSILKQNDCPNAKKVFQHTIQLPFYEGMSRYQISYVAKTLERVLKE